jgi:hypothetical protein
VPGEVTTLKRGDTPNTWEIDNPDPSKKVNSAKLTEMSNALTGLKILGVRPKPGGLTKDLKESADGQFKLSQQALLSLQSRGFYRTRQGTLVSNQGEIRVGTDQGVVYVLRFGEVTVADGEALSAGTSDDESPENDKSPESSSPEAKPSEKAGIEGRFLFITTTFDPNLIPPVADPEAGRISFLPADPFQQASAEVMTPGFEDDVAAEQQRLREKSEKIEKELDSKRQDGRKLVEQLSNRYASWYYVVTGDAFKSIAADRSEILQDAAESSPTPTGFPGNGLPGNFPGLNLPPG